QFMSCHTATEEQARVLVQRNKLLHSPEKIVKDMLARTQPQVLEGANDPAPEKRYVFNVSDIDIIPDIHGNPFDAKLVIFIGGNKSFVSHS
ncbi:MAG: hypothetical protein JWQ49_677, partial [Edaphobacter sp.]|nr:hypothetical protein [Edaphobacter sp.]